MAPARSRRIPIAVLLVAAFFLVPSSVDFYTDWLWFGEVGYQSIYLRALTIKSTLAAVVFGAAFAFLFLNLRIAFRTVTRRELVIVTPDGPRVIVVDPTRLKSLVAVAAGVGALILSVYAGSHWEDWMRFWNATPFGKADPVLGRDVGFYVFVLPFLQWLQSFALLLVILTVVGVIATYVGAGRMGVGFAQGFYVRPPALAHLAGLAALWLVVLAFGAWLTIPELLTTP